MVFQFRHRSLLVRSKGTKLAITSMILAVGLAFFDSVWSVYLNNIVGDVALTGMISSFLALSGILFLIFSTPIIERFAETKIWIWSILFSALSFIAFYFLENILLVLIVALIIVFAGVLRRQSQGILVRDLTKAKELGKAEGTQVALSNIGWMTGPLIAGLLAAQFGERSVFVFTSLTFLLAYAFFKKAKISDKNRFTEDDGTLKSSLKNLRKYFNDSERTKNYFMKGGINLYWGSIFLFLPIFIVKQGLPLYWFGIFLFAVTTPLILSEVRIGTQADKNGFKKFFVLGYLILSIGSFISFFFTNIYAWLIIFTIASIGAAMLEGTTEGYFFKTVKRRHEEKYYGPFTTSIYSVSGIGKLIISGTLFFLPGQYAFLMLSLLMFTLFLVALTIKEKRHKVIN